MKTVFEQRRLRGDIVHVSGSIVIREAELQDPDFYKDQALTLASQGAELIDLSIEPQDGGSAELEADLLLPVLRVLVASGLCVGVATTCASVMELCCQNGAEFIIDESALRDKKAASVIAKYKIPVIIACKGIASSASDVVAAVSEFFYERIDYALEQGMQRRQVILDPFLGNVLRVDSALHLLGRIESLKSFGLPLCMSVPQNLPFDVVPGGNVSSVAGLTASLFGAAHGVSIIRTDNVRDVSLALATWQLAACTARPHQLSKGIIRRFIKMRDAFRMRKSRK